MALSPKKLIFGKEKALETVGLDTDLENDCRVFITCTLWIQLVCDIFLNEFYQSFKLKYKNINCPLLWGNDTGLEVITEHLNKQKKTKPQTPQP